MPKKVKETDNELETWDMPCFPCTNLFQCGVGQENTPIYCECLNDWIKENTNIKDEK
ncbi:MAG: hypothetical protein ACFFDI_11975 [Promethearchaeota archaeon]